MGVAFKSLGEKCCELKGGDYELNGCNDVNDNNDFVHECIIIGFIASISWWPHLMSQLFSPRLLKAAPFYTAWLFLYGLVLQLQFNMHHKLYNFKKDK